MSKIFLKKVPIEWSICLISNLHRFLIVSIFGKYKNWTLNNFNSEIIDWSNAFKWKNRLKSRFLYNFQVLWFMKHLMFSNAETANRKTQTWHTSSDAGYNQNWIIDSKYFCNKYMFSNPALIYQFTFLSRNFQFELRYFSTHPMLGDGSCMSQLPGGRNAFKMDP